VHPHTPTDGLRHATPAAQQLIPHCVVPDGQPHVEVSLPGGLRIAWDGEDVIRSFDDSWSPPSGGHRIALAFACESPGDVDATYESLTSSGYVGHRPPWDAFWGQRYAIVLDPDGNHAELFADAAATA